MCRRENEGTPSSLPQRAWGGTPQAASHAPGIDKYVLAAHRVRRCRATTQAESPSISRFAEAGVVRRHGCTSTDAQAAKRRPSLSPACQGRDQVAPQVVSRSDTRTRCRTRAVTKNSGEKTDRSNGRHVLPRVCLTALPLSYSSTKGTAGRTRTGDPSRLQAKELQSHCPQKGMPWLNVARRLKRIRGERQPDPMPLCH